MKIRDGETEELQKGLLAMEKAILSGSEEDLGDLIKMGVAAYPFVDQLSDSAGAVMAVGLAKLITLHSELYGIQEADDETT